MMEELGSGDGTTDEGDRSREAEVTKANRGVEETQCGAGGGLRNPQNDANPGRVSGV